MKEVTRREAMVRATGIGMGLVGVMLSVPAIGFLLSPLFTRQRTTWVTVGPIDDVPVNQPVALVADVPVGTGYPTPPVKRVVYVVRTPEGQTLALSNICTHMQCDVHWDTNLGRFLCPCHGGLYDIEGRNIGGPPPQPLPQWVHRTHVDAAGRTILEIENRLEEFNLRGAAPVIVSRLLTRPLKARLRAGVEWFDDRTGATELLHKGLYEAVPRQGGWAYALGSATLALILLQLFSGIFLLLDYVPSVTDAFKSLDYLRTSDAFGAWVRGLHLWGAYTLIFVIGLHMLRTFLSASYKRPRELNWVSGALLFFLVLGLAITGAMLPWDEAAYWTTTVVTNIPHYIPVIGDGLRTLWRGGDFVGPITLTRTFAIHVWVLPFLLFTLIGGHLYLLRRHGEFGAWINYDTDPAGNEELEITDRIRRAEPPYPTKRIERRYAAPRETVPFFPDQLVKDVALSTILIAVIFIMGLISGAPLDEPANPATLTYVPTPEWFFLPLDQFLVVAPSNPLIAIGIFGVLGLGALLMVLLPFIDRSPERRPLRRPEVIIPALFMAFTVVFFAVLGINRLYNL